MGCSTSKDHSGVTTSTTATATTTTTKPKVDPATALTHLVVTLPTVLQQAAAVVQTGAHHLKNIFAVPLPIDDATFQVPYHVKSTADQKILLSALASHFLFAHLTIDEANTLVGAMEQYHVPAQQTLITQGDVGDYAYILRTGQVQFTVNTIIVATTTTTPFLFGELSLLYTCPRAASVLAITDCDLYRVDQTTFRYIVQRQTKQQDTLVKELLQQVPFVKELDPNDLNKLMRTMKRTPFQAGEYICTKGTPGDAFYIIQSGTVKVNDIFMGGQSYQDQQLGPGDFFGERALVTKEPRAANCIGDTPGILLTIDRDTFVKVLGNLSQLVVKATDRRILAALKIVQESHLDPSDLASLADLIVDSTFTKGTVICQPGGTPVDATFYLVRQGSVELRQGNSTKIIGEGGYFGDDMWTADVRNNTSHRDPTDIITYTATVLEDATVGCLTLQECRTIIDTVMIGKPKMKVQVSMVIHSEIQFKDLERHTILGAGTFGQVWLVSRTNKDNIKRPYALKVQSKYELIQSCQATGVVQEKAIMAQLNHPFIIQLVNTYQDKQRVYMLLGLVQGGELYSVLHQSNFDGVSEQSAIFYAAGILEGLSHMHRKHILYRDLKPENVLIDSQGYPVIVDLGFAKYVPEKTYTLCGTPLYIAPEIILNRGHAKGADHWSLGSLIFEMITGRTPFYKEGMDQITLFRAIVRADYTFPESRLMSNDAEDLIFRLLVVDPNQRLGSLARGQMDLYQHSWFRSIHFDRLKRKGIQAPWIPTIHDPLDTANFGNWDHLEDKNTKVDPPITIKDDLVFSSF